METLERINKTLKDIFSKRLHINEEDLEDILEEREIMHEIRADRLDSLAQIEFIMAIEESLQLSISEEERKKLSFLNTIIKFLKFHSQD